MTDQLSLPLNRTTGRSKTIRALIIHLLEQYPHLRDDDFKLWAMLLGWCGIGSLDTVSTLIEKMQTGTVPGLDSLTRIRRMVQTDRSDLRGELWDARHTRGEEHRMNIDQKGR